MAEYTQEYGLDDNVQVSCNDCEGCQKCCEHMGDSIVLDPYDIFLLTKNLKLAGGIPVTYDILVSEDGPLALSNQDGIILPSMKMVENGQCPFLNSAGRCSIHPIRPGMCRLYPLGRNYHPDHIAYFILDETLGCPAKKKGPILVKDWLCVKNPQQYEAFLLDWHMLRKNLRIAISEGLMAQNLTMEQASHLISRFLLLFYHEPYGDDFYQEFQERKKKWQG